MTGLQTMTRASSWRVVWPAAALRRPSWRSGVIPSAMAWPRTSSAWARASTRRLRSSVMSSTSWMAKRPRYPVLEQAWQPAARYSVGLPSASSQTVGQRAAASSVSSGS